MSGRIDIPASVPTLLAVNTAINFAKGVPGSAGAQNDTVLVGVKILKNASPATLTLNSGFRDSTGAQNTTGYVLSGSTTADTVYSLGWLNSAGPLQMTASVASMVIVETIPY